MKKIILLFIIIISGSITPCYAIKIGLVTDAAIVTTGTSVVGTIVDANDNRTVCDVDAMKSYEIKAYENILSIKINGEFFKLKSDSVVIKPKTAGFSSVKGKWYRGELLVVNKGGKLTVINNVGLEDYIKGVVPAEMPSSWQPEAHKAQAIAARSYALANLGKRSSLGFDLKDTPEDQAYGGASVETINTNQAVDDTKGIVLTYNMKIINALYSASAGGKTSTSEMVWGGSLPYTRSVPSFDDNVKKNGHGVGMSQHGANNLAKNGYNAYQILQYFYSDVKFARVDKEFFS